MKTGPTPRSDSLPALVAAPRLDDEAVIQIHDFIHQFLDRFEACYGDQIRRFYEGLGGDVHDWDDPPF